MAEVTSQEVLDVFIGILDALDARKFKKQEQLQLAHELVSRFLNARVGGITIDDCPGCQMPNPEED